jgi:hypothetical protein
MRSLLTHVWWCCDEVKYLSQIGRERRVRLRVDEVLMVFNGLPICRGLASGTKNIGGAHQWSQQRSWDPRPACPAVCQHVLASN